MTPERQEKARHLIKAMNTERVLTAVIENILTAIRVNSDMPDEFFTEFMRELNQKEILEMAVPVYANLFSVEEMEQMIAFYESPIGKRYNELAPTLSLELHKIGEAWGKKAVLVALERLEAKENKLLN